MGEEQLVEEILEWVDILESPADPATIMEEALSIECIMRSIDGAFLGAELLMSYGGPTIRIDTRWSVVEGSWGDSHYTRSYSDECGLNDYLESLFG
jgi:hypothetical protein